MPHQQAIIFDLDGTLVDAFADITAAVNVPLAKRGFPLHEVDTIRRMVGDGAGKLLDRALPPVPPEEFEELRREMLEHYAEHPADHAFVYEGVLPMLDRLKAEGVRMGILSNKPHPMTLGTLAEMGLTGYFDEIMGEDFPRIPRKPDPMGLRMLIERLGAEEVYLVGDGMPDGQVAEAAGVPFIACLWGTRNREELSRANPLAFAEDVAKLDIILQGLLGIGEQEALVSE